MMSVAPRSGNRKGRLCLPFLLELQRQGVDAVALTGGAGAVVEDVAQVRAAAGAQDLGARHAEAAILLQADGLGHRGLREARSARPGIELRVGREQLGAAGAAAVRPVLLRIGVRAGEGRLRALLAQHVVALGSELLAPL